jgi:hypothetical protein
MDQFNLNFAWFISLLFFFFLFFGLGHALKGKLSAGRTIDPRRQGSGSFESGGGYSWIILVAVGSLCALSYYVINSFMPFERWLIIGNVIQFQSPRLLVYISYFGLGVYAFTRQWFIKKSPPGKLLFWGSISAVLIFVFFAGQPELLKGSGPPTVTLFYSFVRYSLCLSLLFFLALLACRYLAKPSKFHDFLADHSYYVYLNHLLLVVVAQLFFRQFADLDSIIKFGGVFSFSLIGGYLLSCFVLKPFPRISLLVMLLSLFALGVATG